MPVHIEDLDQGDWVAICDVRIDGYLKTPLDGTPFCVMTKSLPWIMVHNLQGAIISLDCRFYDFMKLEVPYVNWWISAYNGRKDPEALLNIYDAIKYGSEHFKKSDGQPIPNPSPITPEQITSKRECPLCKKQLRDKLIADEKWGLSCECGFAFADPQWANK